MKLHSYQVAVPVQVDAHGKETCLTFEGAALRCLRFSHPGSRAGRLMLIDRAPLDSLASAEGIISEWQVKSKQNLPEGAPTPEALLFVKPDKLPPKIFDQLTQVEGLLPALDMIVICRRIIQMKLGDYDLPESPRDHPACRGFLVNSFAVTRLGKEFDPQDAYSLGDEELKRVFGPYVKHAGRMIVFGLVSMTSGIKLVGDDQAVEAIEKAVEDLVRREGVD